MSRFSRGYFRKNEKLNKTKSTELEEELEREFTSDIDQNEKIFKETFQDCSDVQFRRVEVNHHNHFLIVYIDNIIDKKMLEEYVIKPILTSLRNEKVVKEEGVLTSEMLPICVSDSSTKVTQLVRNVLEGEVAILIPGNKNVMSYSIPDIPKRSLDEPSSEPVIRGPKDGFIEHISTNISLIRTRLKTSKLKVEFITVGRHSQTRIAISYLKDTAQEKLVDEVRKRLNSIQLDGVLDATYIEECIEDQPYSPFPQVHSTERPDVVVAELLEGKVAILVDTTPFVLVVPMTFWTGLQASEDYYTRWPVATFVRLIRFIFINFAIFAPPLYVAITTFHQEMIPTNLVLRIAASREEVPFPAMVEALFIEIIFEALREAGIRLPKQIGQAISIVGGLVIGQAAVQAGLISAPVVIIVSITGISMFTIPRYSFANGIRLLRFPMLFLAGAMGLYGIVLGVLGIVLHMTSLRSFGVLYFSPVAPLKFPAMKDIFIRIPAWAKFRRV
ncbi:spore germination protein [Paenibacillus sp. NPDC058071]|uniref:spore germination protein n=1 Tax=Paenibacillus sp. NPDC058071 TaxID=3346326 RepID=UPI0036D81460